MAATYRLSRWRRLLNALVRFLLRVGLGPRHTYLLTVRGRRTGTRYSTPVMLVEDGTERWIVAPCGEVSWVRNARAAGQVTLSRVRRSETVAIVELGPEEVASDSKRDVAEIPATRPFFDAKPNSYSEAFVTGAPRHPAFLCRRALSIISAPSRVCWRAKQQPDCNPACCDEPRAPKSGYALKNSPAAAEYILQIPPSVLSMPVAYDNIPLGHCRSTAHRRGQGRGTGRLRKPRSTRRRLAGY